MLDYAVVALCALTLLFSILAFAASQKAKKRASQIAETLNGTEMRIADRLGSQLEFELRQSRMEMQQSISENTRASSENLHRVYTVVQTLRTDQLESLDKISERMHLRLQAMQTDSQAQLERMRQTVDEKLQKTLDERLGQSFSAVSERLEAVYKGLGEMHTLATGVGDLKKVLANVKTRGITGEIQLSRILEQMLTPSQYMQNVATKRDSNDRVEYAIVLPGRSTDDRPVLLPIDAKFPLEDYRELMDAYDTGDADKVDLSRKKLENAIRRAAKDIADKYIDPPNTTNFAILFLPIEGLYAEIVRNSDLLESLQNTLRINIAGPTTLSALLNSLQMGFRTLAIEQRSNEIYNILKSVKTEFVRFSDVLTTAQTRIKQADADIDRLVGVRTRQIIRKLRGVEDLPQDEAREYLDTPVSFAEEEDA